MEVQLNDPTDEPKGGIKSCGKTDVWVTGQRRTKRISDRQKDSKWKNECTQKSRQPDRQTDRQTDNLNDTVN